MTFVPGARPVASLGIGAPTCRKTFNPLTETPLAGRHYQDRWNDQAQALINGETVAKAAKRGNVAYSTAFRWRHRFLSALTLDKPQHLSGIVEADETFILESFKGKRSGLPRASRKRGGKASKRGLSAEQIPVMVARDRTGATIDAILLHLDAASITAALGHVITRPAELCCDGAWAVTRLHYRSDNFLLRLTTRKPDVLRFLTDPSVPFTNNLAEQDGRMMKLLQKISGGFRSHDGAKDFAVISSVLSTARKQDWNMLQTLIGDPAQLIAAIRRA